MGRGIPAGASPIERGYAKGNRGARDHVKLVVMDVRNRYIFTVSVQQRDTASDVISLI